MRKSKWWLKLGLTQQLNKRTIHFQRTDKAKGKNLEFQVGKLQEDIYVGELKNMGLADKVCYVGSSGDKLD